MNEKDLFDVRVHFREIVYKFREEEGLYSDKYAKQLFDLCTDRTIENLQQFCDTIVKIFTTRWEDKKWTCSCHYLFGYYKNLNELFILVAQFLVANKLVASVHYFDVLMPSVKNFELPIGFDLQSVREQNIEDLFLTDDEYLVSVPLIIEIAELRGGTINVTSPSGPRIMSPNEQFRINSVDHFCEMIRDLLKKYPRMNTGLTQPTVEAVWRLACGITYNGGAGRTYNEKEQKRTVAAGDVFMTYLDTLLPREYNALMSYFITRPDGDVGKAFCEVLQSMNSGNACTHGIGKYCYKLVFDFMRDLRHVSRINIPEDVLELHPDWLAQEPDVLQFASPDDFSDNPSQRKARNELFVLSQNIKSYDWNLSFSFYSIEVSGRGKVKIPGLVMDALNLITAAEKAKQTDWERQHFNIVRMFMAVAKKPQSLLCSNEEYQWYRNFLKKDFLENLVKDFYQEEYQGAIMLNY